MPRLKNLVCQIQWSDTGLPFQEYNTSYGDGVVESYIAVPNKPTTFTIHLTSKGFIYEGLAVIVFIDGHYQCNRNRVNLLPAKKGLSEDRTQIDFLFRQKEKAMGDEMFLGREWRFDSHNIVPILPEGVTNSHFDELGSIEVIVLRCTARDLDDTNESTTSSAAASAIFDKEKGTPTKAETHDEAREKSTATMTKPAKAAALRKEEEEEDDDDDDAALPFMGLFDGPADYGRQPYPQTPFGPPPSGRQGPFGQLPSYTHPSYPSREGGRFGPQQHSGPPPPPGDQSYPHEKKVHFDYGRDQGPASDHARYWDDPSQVGSRPHPPHNSYYTPGLSDWRRHPPTYDDARSEYVPPPHYNYGSYGSTAGHQALPPPGHHFDQPQPHHYNRQPWGHTPQYPHAATSMPPWTSGHPPPPWAQQMYDMPHPLHPQAFNPYNLPYEPHNSSLWGSGITVGGPNAADAAQAGKNTGSLDPAKDENNAGDSWDTKNDSTTHQNNTTGDQGGWDANGNNADGGDNQEWEDDNNNQNNDNQQGNEWNNNDNQTTNNNTGWKSSAANDAGNPGWDNSNQIKTASGGGWTDDNKATNASAGGWADDSKMTNTSGGGGAGPNVTSSGSGVRPLYGPHGAYYAVQSSNALEVPCDAEEEQPYDVPASFVDQFGSSKQVQPGRGYLYWKKRIRPDYIDELSEPYARFVFLYRTKEELKAFQGIDVDEPSGNEEVQSFQNMNRDDLIQMLLRAKGALGGKIPSPPPQTSKAADEPSFRGVPVEAPIVDFLEYDIPGRGGKPDGGAGSNNDDANPNPNANSTSTNGGNGDWNATGTNDTSKSVWSSGTDNKASNNTSNSNNNNSWDSKANESWAKNNNDATANDDFGQDSWDAARQQQSSGSPPDPPGRSW